QAWQARMVEGVTPPDLVGGRRAGVGPRGAKGPLPGAPRAGAAPRAPAHAREAPLPPGPRLYSGADDARFQDLRRRLEGGWIEMLCARVGVEPARVPLLGDVAFLLGERRGHEPERYVLCEINVSSVSPFPESAIPRLVEATRDALKARR